MTQKEQEQDNNPFVSENTELEGEEKDKEIAEEPQSEQEDSTESPLEQKYEQLNNQYVRLAADFENYRKRQMQERESLLKYGAGNTVEKLLPVIDTFERATKSVQDLDDPEKIKESLDVIYKQFMESLEKAGVKKIDTVGKEFDHNLHEAVMQTPTDEHPDHSIIQELQSGYMLEDRVLSNPLVTIRIYEEDNCGVLEIEDNGGGIDTEVLPKIFEPYYTTKHQSQGTGIGLYMSKVIVEQNMQGKLTAKNINDGVIFTIKIPMV